MFHSTQLQRSQYFRPVKKLAELAMDLLCVRARNEHTIVHVTRS
jgi:hypothetical protein